MKVIILAGSRDSGKTSTLRELATSLNGRRILQLEGKQIWINYSSLQEQKAFCHYDEISASIRRRLTRAGAHGCSLVILPFTLIVSQRGRHRELLNRDCIVRPIEDLRERHIEVHVVYLRRPHAHLDEFDRLMDELRAHRVVSNQQYQRQAQELLQFIRRVDA